MNHLSNSQIEHYYFEQFRRDYSLPDGEIHYTDRPDIIVRGSSTLGIEVTNLYLVRGDAPTSEQVQRRRREQVLQRAQSAFLASGGKRFELSVAFDPNRPIEKIEPIARGLCTLAHQLVSAETGVVSPPLFAYIEQLRFVYLNAAEYPDARWRLAQGFSVPSLSIERLREVVAEKSAKLSEYQACDQYWLLVIVDLMDAAQDQHLVWSGGALAGGTPFKKVLLYKPQYRCVLEVPH